MDQPRRTVLSSDHINYLVWRYLNESGYWKAAMRLEQQWGRGNPELLKFHQNIDTYALINLLQQGLQHVLALEQVTTGTRPTKTPVQLFFGTDEVWDSSPNVPTEAPRRAASPRKHHRESTANSALDSTSQAPAAKRPRRATALDGANAIAKSGDEMDVDDQAVSDDAENSNDNSRTEHSNLPNGRTYHQDSAPGLSPSEPFSNAAAAAASPSPPPKVSTLEKGHSTASQTNRVTELGSKVTQVLDTTAQQGLLTAWNPQQPNVLVSGGDGVCTLYSWPVHFGDAPATNGSTLTGPPPQTIDLYDKMSGATVTALAWSPDGRQLAVARHSELNDELSSTITLFDAEGRFLTTLEASVFALGLAYNQSSTNLLGFGGTGAHYPDGDRDYGIYVWDTTGAAESGGTMATLLAERQEILGATWADDSIIACGPGFLSQTKLEEGKLQDWQPILPDVTHGPDDAPYHWDRITWDKFSGECALAERSQGLIAILSKDRQSLKTHIAHNMEITSLQFQPLPRHGSDGKGPRLLQSASADGKLKIWNVAEEKISCCKVLFCWRSREPEKFPILAAQFSPDGASIAAATHSRVFVWLPDEKSGEWPIAEWELKADMGWKTSGLAEVEAISNGHAEPTGNGMTNGVNGLTNGHAANGESVNEAVQADRMDIDDTEGKARQEMGTQVEGSELPEEDFRATLLWSALGKRLAFGNKSQIAVADYAKAAMQ